MPKSLLEIYWDADGGAGGTGAAGGTGQTGTSSEATPADGNASGDDKDSKGKAYTQAELDRAISKAIETREKAHKEEQQRVMKAAEEAALKEKNSYKELYERTEQEKKALLLKTETQRELAARNLGDLGELFDQDFNTVDGRKAAMESLEKKIAAEVEKRVADRLKSPAGTKGAPAGTAPPGKLTAEDIAKMSYEDYKKARQENRV
jgi:hypothetical protein